MIQLTLSTTSINIYVKLQKQIQDTIDVINSRDLTDSIDITNIRNLVDTTDTTDIIDTIDTTDIIDTESSPYMHHNRTERLSDIGYINRLHQYSTAFNFLRIYYNMSGLHYSN